MTITKAEIEEGLIEDCDFVKKDARDMVENIFEVLRETLENGQNVKLSGFGKFELRDKNARPGRNPKTGEEKTVKARRVVTFNPGQQLKGAVEDYNGPEKQADDAKHG